MLSQLVELSLVLVISFVEILEVARELTIEQAISRPVPDNESPDTRWDSQPLCRP